MEGVPLYMGNYIWQFNRMGHVVDNVVNGDGRIRDFTIPDGKIMQIEYFIGSAEDKLLFMGA